MEVRAMTIGTAVSSDDKLTLTNSASYAVSLQGYAPTVAQQLNVWTPLSDVIILPINFGTLLIPAREQWVYQNPARLASLERGLSQPAVHDLGVFTQYVDDAG